MTRRATRVGTGFGEAGWRAVAAASSPQVALLPPVGPSEAAPRLKTQTPRGRPLVRIAAFGALATYGVLRWATLERAAPTWRLLGLLALALALAAAGPPIRRRSPALAGGLVGLAVVAMFPIAGVPLAWVTHLRIAVTASAIGEGISAMPAALVPYGGVDQWLRLVIALGAGLLLIDAAAMVALAPRAAGGVWRAAAALPLLALAVIPSTLAHPRFPYLEGVVVFALLAAFTWVDRVERSRAGAAVALCAAAAALAVIAAPALERHRPWLDPHSIAGRLVGARNDSFDWSQGYGPIDWPRDFRTVLEVRAPAADYWKAENLDLFAGRGWVLDAVPGAEDPSSAISQSARARWTHTIQVTVRSMASSQVIAAGAAGQPTGLAQSVVPDQSPGTWSADGVLGPGESYSIRTYSPHPSDAELAAAGTAYPSMLLPGYLTIYIPGPAQLPGQLQQVVFAPFGSSRATAYGPASPDPSPLLRASPYARAYALALRLERSAPTPLTYVRAVEAYLARGFAYNENPPVAAYPLETFLFATRAGYCQQFAGAMALLLRMGGVPARVSVGFTQGSYDSATRRWVVSDLDAHAWVEAWFPSYGWVRFDPTPGAAPALGGRSAISSSTGSGSASRDSRPSGHGHGRAGAAASAAQVPSHGGGLGGAGPVLAIAAALALAALAAAVIVTRPLRPGEPELAELERAFARAGRPLGPRVTLLALEHRLAASPAAAGYVSALRRARFGGSAGDPASRARRALRAQLRVGLGPLGRVRALWALPPRRARRGGA